VAGVFLVLATLILLLSLREWVLLLARRKLATLRESDPVWLPDYAIMEAKPMQAASLLALAFALTKELSGEAHLARAQQTASACECGPMGSGALEARGSRRNAQRLYVEVTEQRFNGVRRCC
jgi:hypothetical protein